MPALPKEFGTKSTKGSWGFGKLAWTASITSCVAWGPVTARTFAGAIVFKLMQDAISAITPQYWTFWIGLFLVVLVLVGRPQGAAPDENSGKIQVAGVHLCGYPRRLPRH